MVQKKSEKRPSAAGVKKQLEAIAEKKLDVTEEQVKFLRWPVGAHDVTDGTVLWKGLFHGQTCVPSPLLDGSGVSSSGASGQVTFLLSSFVCLPLVRSLAEPVNLLATARSANPFFVTLTHKMVADPNSPQSFNDVEITAYVWDANGAPAPGVAFDWRCRVVSYPIIL